MYLLSLISEVTVTEGELLRWSDLTNRAPNFPSGYRTGKSFHLKGQKLDTGTSEAAVFTSGKYMCHKNKI